MQEFCEGLKISKTTTFHNLAQNNKSINNLRSLSSNLIYFEFPISYPLALNIPKGKLMNIGDALNLTIDSPELKTLNFSINTRELD